MIHKGLSAWLTDSHGNALEEYQPVILNDETAESWILSVEGAGFRVKWKHACDALPTLGIRCDIRLDGRDISSRILSAKSIAAGISGEKDGMSVAPGVKRPLEFGRQSTKDQDQEVSLDDSAQADLGIIRVQLTWVRCTYAKRLHKYEDPEEPSRLHVRDAKQGHSIMAILGAPIQTGHKFPTRAINTYPVSPPVVFVFRYGPKDWLKAKGIIPSEPVEVAASPTENESAPSSEDSSMKRKREPSPTPTIESSQPNKKRSREFESDVIDIDDLESDTDSEVVILSDLVEAMKCGAAAKEEKSKWGAS